MTTKKTTLTMFILALASSSLTFASNSTEPNEAIDELYNCEVFAKNVWSQVYLSPELRDIPTDLGFTSGNLLTHAYLYRDEDGTRINPRVYVVENNVRLRLDVPKDGEENVPGLVFNFSVDFATKDPGGVIEGSIAEGHGAILTDAHMHLNGVRIGKIFEQLEAAKLLKAMLMDSVSKTDLAPRDIADATKRARQALSERVDIQFEYKDDIDSGPYGIPLNASFDRVLSWCSEKNMQVTDSVEKVPVFESVEFVQDGQARRARDSEFTERLYKIELAPSEELRNEQIRNITIYFQKTAPGDYISYGVLFCHLRPCAPYATLNTMMQVLNQKYGNFEIIPVSSKDKGIGSQIYTLTGMDFHCTEAAIWKRNIILMGKFMYSEAQPFPPQGTPKLEPANSHEPFYLLYFTPTAGASIPKAYEDAVETCRNKYLQEKEASRKRMVDTF